MKTIVGFLLALALAPGAGAATWFVDDAADPAEDGSAAHPFDAIQEALDAAVSNDEVAVLAGTYTGDGNKTLDFRGKAILLRSLQGAANTVIDCEGTGRAFHVHSGETTNTTIRGFRITGANTSVVTEIPIPNGVLRQYGSNGCAIVCVSNSSLTVEACELVGNQAMTRWSMTDDYGDPVRNATGDADGRGGAVYCEGGTLVLRDTLVASNRAGVHGGGVCLVSNAVGRFEGASFIGNACGFAFTNLSISIGTPGDAYFHQLFGFTNDGSGGGIYAVGSVLEMTNCLFEGNSAARSGGGLFAVSCPSVRLRASVVAGNRATGSTEPSMGGGVGLEVCSADIAGVTFVANRCGMTGEMTQITIDTPADPFYQQTRSVAARGYGGALALDHCPSGSVADVVFSNNLALAQGGGATVESCPSLTVSNACFVGNRVVGYTYTGVYPGIPGSGGGLRSAESGIRIIDSVMEGNAAICPVTETTYTIGGPGDSFYQTTKATYGNGIGGAVFLAGGTVDIVRGRMNGNASAVGGGLAVSSGAIVSVEGLLLSGNRSAGVESVGQRKVRQNPPSSVLNTRFDSDAGGRGGGCLVLGATGYLMNVRFEENRAGEGGGGLAVEAGAVFATNVVWVRNASAMIATNIWLTNELTGVTQAVAESRTTTGGAAAVALNNAEATLQGVTMAWNRGTNDLALFGTSRVEAANTVVWSNGVLIDPDSVLTAAYSCIVGAGGGPGLLGGDPRVTRDGRLRADSPGIDAGTAAGAATADLDGEARWDHPSHSNLYSLVDIGADEFVDLDGDAMADAWERQWFGSTSAGPAQDDDADGLGAAAEHDAGTNPLDADTEGDRVPDGWELAHGLDPFAPDWWMDPDGDGCRNLDEYVAWTDPWDANSIFHVAVVGGLYPGQAVLGWASASGRVYTVEWCLNPDDAWNLVTNLTSAGWQTSYTNQATEAHRLMRVHVALP